MGVYIRKTDGTYEESPVVSDETGNREFDTVYQNTSGYALLVIVTVGFGSDSSGSITLKISQDNSTWSSVCSVKKVYYGNRDVLVAVVPKDWYYMLSTDGDATEKSIVKWWEVKLY